MAAGVLCLAGAPAATATTGQGPQDPAARELADLRQRIQAADREGDALRKSIRELRDAGMEERLAARRLDLIRSVVDDTVYATGVRTSMLSDGYHAGWDGGFFLEDPSGNFRLDFGAYSQVRLLVNKRENNREDATRGGFDIPRTRLTFSGHVFTPDLKYHVSMDPTRDERFQGPPPFRNNLPAGIFFLDDAWVSWQLDRHWSVRAGQFKLGFNREESIDARYQQAIDRTLVNESLNLGRTQGIEFRYEDADTRLTFAITDGPTDDIGGNTNRIGAANPQARINSEALQPDYEYSLTARWETLYAGSWEQFDDMTSDPGDDPGFMLGVGIHVSETESGLAPAEEVNTLPRDEVGWFGATVDASFEFGGSNLFGSVIYHYLDRDTQALDILGGVLQGGWYIMPDHEVFGRWEAGHLKATGVRFADLNLFTVGWNWYIDGHDLKFSTDFGFAHSIVDVPWISETTGWRQDRRGDEHQWVLRSQFQMIF